MLFMLDVFMALLVYLVIIIGVLVGVAFLVLLERSVLGYIQVRSGPNKVGYVGVLQSFGDAVKLFISEQFVATVSNPAIYFFSPVVSLFLSLILWVVFPYDGLFLGFMLGGLFFLCCTGFGVYTLMGSGWASNSNYALLGATRGVAQTISYEVSLALIFLSLVVSCGSFNFSFITESQGAVWFGVLCYPLFLCWLVSCLAETNRTPFDFAEGESELVSGFNVEYGSGAFALLFLAEYGSIIFMSFMTVCLFMGGAAVVWAGFNFLGVGFCVWFIWVRGTLPRYRYDKLMYLAWSSFLPLSLWFLLFYFGVGL